MEIAMPYRIIIVDDDPMNLKIAGRILGKENNEITLLGSGYELLEHVRNNVPDIILLDIKMPGMDGFETFDKLRSFENESGRDETPVVFLTADDASSTESRGFEAGVSDYIRKPFEPEILIKRINNILDQQDMLHHFKREAMNDKLTGFLNKAAANEKLSLLYEKEKGCLMMIDLDSFKLVNDIYGHDAGDKILSAFGQCLSFCLPSSAVIGRIGGDEFNAFCNEYSKENEIAVFCDRLNTVFLEKARDILGQDMDIPLGVSVGAIFNHNSDYDYASALSLADKALYSVKENKKHGYAIHKDQQGDNTDSKDDPQITDLNTLNKILSERNIPDQALSLDMDSFINVYRFIMRYLKRYHRSACRLLFTVENTSLPKERFYELCDRFFEHMKNSLRKSDLVMRHKISQMFVFLTDVREYAIRQVADNIIKSWYESNGKEISVSYESEDMDDVSAVKVGSDNPLIAVVDDDPLILRLAEKILLKNNMNVAAFSSGEALIDYLKDNSPELILLDVKMSGMDGFETLSRLRNMEEDIADIPVIFLTANDDDEFETRGLSLGAMDFIKKPFFPDVLILRVRHCIELIRLQRTLYLEVEKKTRKFENLLLQVVGSLADAIDAKDSYTKGHSKRVAEYSREIARRYGYSQQKLNDIYMMGLLHDVGKIGVPDVVINKPARLNDEEFDMIKQHTVVGAQILNNIREFPKLSEGAKWHHEKYDGSGYPDGLSGEEIPEEARIIAVADAYDAMTSNRSYRNSCSREYVINEFITGKSKQFDPVFADIMLEMINEDTGFNMREK